MAALDLLGLSMNREVPLLAASSLVREVPSSSVEESLSDFAPFAPLISLRGEDSAIIVRRGATSASGVIALSCAAAREVLPSASEVRTASASSKQCEELVLSLRLVTARLRATSVAVLATHARSPLAAVAPPSYPAAEFSRWMNGLTSSTVPHGTTECSSYLQGLRDGFDLAAVAPALTQGAPGSAGPSSTMTPLSLAVKSLHRLSQALEGLTADVPSDRACVLGVASWSCLSAALALEPSNPRIREDCRRNRTSLLPQLLSQARLAPSRLDVGDSAFSLRCAEAVSASLKESTAAQTPASGVPSSPLIKSKSLAGTSPSSAALVATSSPAVSPPAAATAAAEALAQSRQLHRQPQREGREGPLRRASPLRRLPPLRFPLLARRLSLKRRLTH